MINLLGITRYVSFETSYDLAFHFGIVVGEWVSNKLAKVSVSMQFQKSNCFTRYYQCLFLFCFATVNAVATTPIAQCLILITNNNLSGKQLCCYFCLSECLHIVNCPLVHTCIFTCFHFTIFVSSCARNAFSIALVLFIHYTFFFYQFHLDSVQSSVDDYWSKR